MDTSMFTGFEGRINRAKWWLGTVVLVVVAIIITLIVGAITGASMMGMMTAGADMASSARRFAIGQLITLVIIAYPVTALMTKRLNDRDRPQALAYLFWLPRCLPFWRGWQDSR